MDPGRRQYLARRRHLVQRRDGTACGDEPSRSRPMNPGCAMGLALAIPTAGAVMIALAGRWPNLREAATLVTAPALFAPVLTLLPATQRGRRPEMPTGSTA